MQDGTFRSVELDYLKSTNNIVDTEENDLKEDDVNSGIDISAYSTLSRFKFYETHEYLDLNVTFRYCFGIIIIFGLIYKTRNIIYLFFRYSIQHF